jgi:hypothetical protein
MKTYVETKTYIKVLNTAQTTPVMSGMCEKWIENITDKLDGRANTYNFATATDAYNNTHIHHDNIPNRQFVYIWWGKNGKPVGAGHVCLGFNDNGKMMFISSNDNLVHLDEKKYLTKNPEIIGWSATIAGYGRLLKEIDV